MLRKSSHRRVAILLVCFGLLLPLGPSWAQQTDVPGPIHAGNTYGWYPTAWRDEFIGPLASHWHKRGQGVVRTKNGMLTLLTEHSGSLSARLAMPGHATGRWEMRWKAETWGSGHPNYTVRTELVPAGTRKQYCGAHDIALESFRFQHARARFYIHNLPNLAFRSSRLTSGAPFGGDNWHTFAVEVTPKHISWFVDARVVSTERRAAALSGVPFTVRFSMKAVPGSAMKPAKMQVDWLRYWTLAKPNDRSIDAPAPVMGTYAGACPNA